MLGTTLLTPDETGTCRFFERDRVANRCRVQREHGESMLPEACHHFPRRALLDDRGTFVTLSHFCPTAASLLFDDAPLTIVRDPPAFPETRTYEGLDARGHWPPLVRRNVLFDLESYSHWETFIVDALEHADSPSAALQRIAAAAEELRAWTPARGDFAAWTDSVLARTTLDAGESAALTMYRDYADIKAYGQVLDTVPVGVTAPSPPDDADDAFARWAAAGWAQERAVRRYLAAKAFGSWAAYEANGVRVLVAELVLSEMVLRTEVARACAGTRSPLNRSTLHAAIRAADWLLIHLVERPQLIKWLGSAEPE